MSAVAALLEEAKAAGIRFEVKGPGQLGLSARKAPPPELVARIKAAKPALLVMLGAVPGVPQEWAEGAAKLRSMEPPAVVSPAAWAALLRASDRFLSEGHAAKAAALGWTALDVWGCHARQPVQRLDLAGAAWLIGDSEIVAIGPRTIALRNARSSSQLTIYRRRWAAGEPVCLAWELDR